MKYNGEFKVIDTQEKAYFLGFMYGDGTITHYFEKSGRERFQTKISIQKIDEDLINQFKSSFPFLCTGEYDYSKHNSKSGKQVSVSKSSKIMYFDLLSNGLYPRKSYENACKLKLPDIDQSLLPHFIRGFFDADGSVYIPQNRPNLISIEICCISKEFIFELDSYFKIIDINSWKVRKKKPKGKSKQILYILTFNKTSEILKLIGYMYDNSIISLKRKADKCLGYRPVNKVLDRNMNCPHCDNNNVTKNGTRGNSIRYKCQDCNKGFSVYKNDSEDCRIQY